LDTISIGKHNPRLADIRKAIQKGELTADGLLPVEGPKLVCEAHASGIPIAVLLVREGVSGPDLPVSAVYTLESAAFKTIQSTEHSQGVIALVRPRSWTLSEVLDKLTAPLVVLAGLQDPGNVGTILRVCESFGAAGCIGLSGTARVTNSKVVRASAGSLFRMPHLWDLGWDTLVNALRERSLPLIGTSPYAVDTVTSWDWRLPAAIMIGNEGAGLSPVQTKACAAMVQIPHEPRAESLNSAVATGVILYEAYRQRRFS
jgi:TrmH family RNA methyltransferase